MDCLLESDLVLGIKKCILRGITREVEDVESVYAS